MDLKEDFGKKWIWLKTQNFIRYIRHLKRKIKKLELEKQEKHLQKFCKLFHIKIKQKITIYSATNRKEMKQVVGYETNGRAEPNNHRVFSIYIYCPHEVVHVLSDNYLGNPNNLLGEGLAVCFGNDNGWHRKSLGYWMNRFIKTKRYIPIKKLLDDSIFKKEMDDNITYPESGAFVKFLIGEFGIKKFKLLYKKIEWKQPIEQSIKTFEKILKDKFDNIENKFIKNYSSNLF